MSALGRLPLGPLRPPLGRLQRRLGRARDRLRRPLPAPRHFLGEYSLLSARPVVLYVSDWTLASRTNAVHGIFDALRRDPAWIVIHPSWSHEDRPQGVERIRRQVEEHVRRHPRHRFLVAANTAREVEAFEAGGVPAFFCSANAFADEAVFRPLPHVPKSWDAVYDARLSPFKRHELAAGVGSLALVVKPSPAESRAEREYREAMRATLRHAHWLNGAAGGLLDPPGVNASLARCRVGLCLSATEGQMRASIQYLLAGLPIVSTASKGGRDVFFDPDHVRIVEPEPGAVAAAVRERADAGLDPLEIRRRVLARMTEHRERLVERVQAMLDEAGEGRRFRDEWPAARRSFLLDPAALPHHVIARVRDARSGGDGRAWPAGPPAAR